jgi:hypothetical protein
MTKAQLFAIGALFFAHTSFAQDSAPAATAPATSYEYVTLVTINGGDSFLDYGQLKELGKQAPVTELEKDYVAIQKIPRAMQALNYLSSRGWEFVSMGNRQQSKGNASESSFRIYTGTEYLLRRRKQ